MSLPFAPIRPKRVSDQVFEQLRELILRGQIKPGERIHPERDLAEALQVSRTSVREALDKLGAMGLLEQRQGLGTFVRVAAPGDDGLLAAAMGSPDASLADLLEVRMGLECSAAALAAQRAEPRDIRLIQNCLAEITAEQQFGRLGAEADAAFHMAIALATKNPVHIFLMRKFYDYLFRGIRENLAHLYEEPATLVDILAQHSRIADGIQRRDPDSAFTAMQTHIRYVMDYVTRPKA